MQVFDEFESVVVSFTPYDLDICTKLEGAFTMLQASVSLPRNVLDCLVTNLCEAVRAAMHDTRLISRLVAPLHSELLRETAFQKSALILGKDAIKKDNRCHGYCDLCECTHDVSVFLVANDQCNIDEFCRNISNTLQGRRYEIFILFQDDEPKKEQITGWSMICLAKALGLSQLFAIVAANCHGRYILFSDNGSMGDASILVEALDKGVAMCSMGDTPMGACCFPSPAFFAISKEILVRMGSIDSLFYRPEMQLSDYASRILMEGLQSQQFASAVTMYPSALPTLNPLDNMLDVELYLAKNGFPLPSATPFVNELSRECLQPHVDVLLVSEKATTLLQNLYDARCNMCVLCKEEISVKTVIALFAGEGKTGEMDVAQEVFNGQTFDLIVLCMSVSDVVNFEQKILSLLTCLRYDGTLHFFDENRCGLHRMGAMLTSYVFGGWTPNYIPSKLRTFFDKAGYSLMDKQLLCDLQADNGRLQSVLNALLAGYTAQASSMRNVIEPCVTIYAVRHKDNIEIR